MRKTCNLLTLTLAIAAGLALSPWQTLPAKSVRAAAQADAEGRSTWIVVFEEPAIASFRGGKPSKDASVSLAATTPAVTGADRFDINAPAARAYSAYLADKRNERLTRAEVEFGRPLLPGFVYEAALNGVALELSADEAARLAKMPGVANVVANWVSKPLTDAGPRWIKADQVWSGAAGVASRGEGVVVGVIDTGVNASHPMFAATSGGAPISNPRGNGNFLGPLCAGGSPCNNKLIGVYDFTTGTGDLEPNNGLDVDGHGSHTASTAVGNPIAGTIDGPSGPVPVTFTGVAPRANLITYKACEVEADCRGNWTLAAIEQATTDKVDVINYSIGGGARNPWQGGDELAMRGAYDAGIVVVVSAGNDGPGAGTITSPANAPWVLTAAAATHTRAITNDLQLSGGVGLLPGGGVLRGAGNTGGASSTGIFDLIVPNDFPLCGTGTDLDFPPTGASKPASWVPPRFTPTQMVLCERGVQARVAKSNNVRLAGGGATVLLNQPENGASLNSDPHSLPTVHLSSVDADALRAWVALGGNPKGRLTGSTLSDDSNQADVLADFSSRGPNPGDTVDIAAVLKPNLTAPGVSILAAAPTGSGVANLSGTSMSAPHITGAAALIIGARAGTLAAKGPTRVDQVVAALTTTARPSARDFDGVTPATPLQQGSGVIDVSLAVKAGLYFPIAAPAPDFQSFTTANPFLTGGDPRKLNLPALVEADCFETCQLKRRVVAYGNSGSWRVEVDAPAGLQVAVSPSSFTLNAGAGQTLTFAITITDPVLAGKWAHGAVRLVRETGDGVADLRMPFSIRPSVGNVPEPVVVQSADDAGFIDIAADGLLAMPNARFLGTALAPAVTTTVVMAEDPTNDQPYDDLDSGVIWRAVQVPPGPGGTPRSYAFFVDLNSSSANDMDLYLGSDGDGDGFPDENEELCASISDASSDETCEIVLEHPGGSQNLVVWWLVQNWAASTNDQGVKQIDNARVDAFLLPLEPVDGGLTVTGPGRIERLAPFNIRASWNDPTFKVGQKRLAYAYLAPDGVPIAAVPVMLARGGSPSAARALVNKVALPIAVAAGESLDRIFFDVPPNARVVTFTATDAGLVNLYAAPAPAPIMGENRTTIDPAPAVATAPFTSVNTLDSKTLVVPAASLTPGRWYLTPVSRGAASNIVLRAEITQADPRPALRSGHYFDSRRIGSSSGLFLDFAGDQWFAVWYAYLEDRTPTWYFGQGNAPSTTDATQTFRGDLLRVVWNGSASSNVKVGEMLVTPTGLESFDFSFVVDGKTGSEPMTRLGAGGCITTDLDVSGHWFSDRKPGFGYSAQLQIGDGTQQNPDQEIFAAYLYDAQGFPRWLFGQKPFDASTPISLWQFSAGACPTCAFSATPAPSVVGALNRNYAPNNITDINVIANLVPPLSGSWNENPPVIPLSDRKNCE